MVQKLMYYRLWPEYAGTENKAVSVHVEVSGVSALDRIDNDLNILHRGAVPGDAHIQAILNSPELCSVPEILCVKPFLLPF